MAKVIGMRLSPEELSLLERAAALDARLGERGGLSSWVRRVSLAAAERVLAAQPSEAAERQRSRG